MGNYVYGQSNFFVNGFETSSNKGGDKPHLGIGTISRL